MLLSQAEIDKLAKLKLSKKELRDIIGQIHKKRLREKLRQKQIDNMKLTLKDFGLKFKEAP